MDEDTIDVEVLQAQIDLSMSFAQNLVASWIQPHKIPRNSHKKNLEKDLLDYMQRPARLGVGASVPEGYNSASRETARLKGKLAGTKHSRDEDDDNFGPQQPSDTEGESRAIAIKKKPKHDPFDVVHGKRKKKEKDIDHEDTNTRLTTANSNLAQLQATIPPQETSDQRLDGHDPNSPTSKKKKNGSSNVLNPSSTPPRGSAELASVDPIPKSQQTEDVSLISTPTLNVQNRHKSIPLDFLTRPLLNLEPHSDHGSDHETPSSPKKKRKRRRKKKNALTMPSVADKIDETSNMS